jgi:cobalt transporter subunit CbtB
MASAEGRLMDKTVAGSLAWALSERLLFFIKSVVLLFGSGIILYVLLAASYPAVHDTLHNVRHALAVVPCH